MMEYRVMADKKQPVEVRLYQQEIEDIVRALEYYMQNVELESLNEKEGDNYEGWYKHLRNGLSNILYNIGREWDCAPVLSDLKETKQKKKEGVRYE